MSEQYLILHKVRGEPSFDCATKMRCPSCESARQGLDHGDDYAGNCTSCDDGWWWITNSGYRAYPVHSWPMANVMNELMIVGDDLTVPTDWPDHFNQEGEKPPPSFNIMAAISGLMPKIRRRV